MKCLKCNRRVQDSDKAKAKHLLKHHPELLIVRAMNVFLNPQYCFDIGRMFGAYVQKKVQSGTR